MLIAFLLAGTVAIHPAFVKVPQFEQVHIRLLKGGPDRIYAVPGGVDEPQRFEINHRNRSPLGCQAAMAIG